MTKQPKFPLLRCPVCHYEYTPTMHGWAFRTDKDTKCIGLDAPQDGTVSHPHSYSHPFEVVNPST